MFLSTYTHTHPHTQQAKAKVLEAMIAALPSGSGGGSFGDRDIGASGDAGFEKACVVTCTEVTFLIQMSLE